MTSCFPRLFVAFGPKRSSTQSRLRAILWVMSFVIVFSLIPPFSQQITVAQTGSIPEDIFLPLISNAASSVPNGCKDDNGNPVKPANGAGAWAIILNFNHAPSTTETIACLAVVTTMQPQKTVEYDDDFRCAIVNNINDVEVGRGKAAFDGNFQLECPEHIHEVAEGIKYDKFIVHAKARFPLAEASYTLVEHSDVHVQVAYAPIDNSDEWNATLTSRYGDFEFSDTQTISTIPDFRFGIQSTILDGKGTHHINRKLVSERRLVDPFSFDFEEPIQIGGEGEAWELYNLVIDPPEPEIACC